MASIVYFQADGVGSQVTEQQLILPTNKAH